MNSFNLLSKSMQKKIWDMKWESLTPIQNKTIPILIETKKDVIISSATASGKTEAAFLPIVSLIEGEAENGLKVLYISPLKALINNQFDRIEKLCEYSSIPIHKWHGDVSQSKKNKFVKNPSGILQITPESVESLFINRTDFIRSLLKDIEYIVIDEIHSFINIERGVQLRSLLSRIEQYTIQRPRIIGLSATIDNFELVKEWVNYRDTENVEIIESVGSEKELLYHLMHFDRDDTKKTPVELFEDIRELTKEQKAIIFCNRREEVEETTVFLNRLAQKDTNEETYYPHHSSIDKKEREYVEKKMMESTTPKSVIATSSLELGIDIGDVDVVIQLDSTFTVSSLKQRLGRSGRKRDSNQMLQLYTTGNYSLLQSLAVMELVLAKWIEPAEGYPLPYDILFHQIISICQETNGISFDELMVYIKNNHIFHTLEPLKVEEVIRFMIENNHLEQIKGRNELIVGIEGERILRDKEFYSVFMSPEEYTVLEGSRVIGTIGATTHIAVDGNLILAGKLWRINIIDDDKMKIYVKKAVDGKPPRYSGGPIDIHPCICYKMMEILCTNQQFEYVNDAAIETLTDMRRPYHGYRVQTSERIIWKERDSLIFETYAGTKVTRNLVLALRFFGVSIKGWNGIGHIFIDSFAGDIEKILKQIQEKEWTAEELISHLSGNELFVSKSLPYLPDSIQHELQAAHKINIQEMKEFLANHTIRVLDLL